VPLDVEPLSDMSRREVLREAVNRRLSAETPPEKSSL